MRLSKLFLFASLLFPSLSIAEQTKTIFNPFTGKPDYITKLSSTTLPSGSTDYVQNNPSGVQSGAFNISSGTVGTGGFNLQGTLDIDRSDLGGIFANRARLNFNPNVSGPSLSLYTYNATSNQNSVDFYDYNGLNYAKINALPPSNASLTVSLSSNAVDTATVRLQLNKAGPMTFNNPQGSAMAQFDPVNNASFTIPVYAASSANVVGQLQVNTIKFNDGTTQVTAPTGGGGGGTTIWVEDDRNSVNTAVSTVSFNGVLGSTTIAGGRVGVFLRYEDGHFSVSGSSLAINTDIFLTAAAGATTYLTQSSGTATYLQNSSATAAYLQNSSATVTYAGINVDLSKASATATYLQNSSATVTYVQFSSAVANYLSLSSATANYVAKTSATATYLQFSSATATYLQNSSAAVTYAGINVDLSKASATATYLQFSSATATYLQLSSAAAAYLPFARIVAGSNITLTPAAGALTIAATGGGGGSGTTIMFREEGADVVASSTLNVVGSNATITNVSGVATLTISGGGGGYELYPTTNTVWADRGIQVSTVAASSVTIGVPVGSAPSARWVLSESTTGQAPLAGSTAHMIGLDGNPLRVTLDSHNNNSNFGTLVAGRRTRGTSLAPLPVQSNDVLLQLGGLGFAATGYSATSVGIMAIKSSEFFSSTGQGTFIEMFTTSNTSVNPQKRLEIANDGTVAVQGTKFGVSRSTFVYENGLPALTSFQTVSSSGIVTWTTAGSLNTSSSSFIFPQASLNTLELAVATVTITPSRADAKILIFGQVSVAKDAGTTARITTISIRQGTTGSGSDILVSTPAVFTSQAVANTTMTATVFGVAVPGSTNQQTYTLRVLLGAGLSTATVKNFIAVEMNGYNNVTVSTATFDMWTNASYVLHTTNTWSTFPTTAPHFGQATFNASIATTTNNVYLKWFAPNDFDSAAEPKGNLSFLYSGVDTSSQTYIAYIASVTHGDNLTVLNFTNPVTFSVLNAVGAEFKVGVSSQTTLTSWQSFIRPGVDHVIRIARQGDSSTLDPSTVNSFFDKFTLYYKRKS